MKIHLRIPHFQAVTAAVAEDTESPLIVVDDGRVLDATPEAIERGLSPGALLENTTIPGDVAEVPFDLDRLEHYQRSIHEGVQSVVPLAESFGFGEVFAEVPDADPQRQILDLSGLPNDFEPCVAASSTGWLSRVLSQRLAPGEVQVHTDDEYDTSLDSVNREELWGLGPDLRRRMAEEEFETLGSLRPLKPEQRRDLLGPVAEALEALFEGRDPRPMNPFSRPASLQQEFSSSGENKQQLRTRLISTVRTLIESLRKTGTRAHRLRLSYSHGNHEPQTATYVYSSPTDEAEVLVFGTESLLSRLKPLEQEGDFLVEVSALVPNVETYHAEVENNPGDLTVL